MLCLRYLNAVDESERKRILCKGKLKDLINEEPTRSSRALSAWMRFLSASKLPA